MPCARATRMAADPPSTSPKATNDVQETLHPLRQEPRARYPLSACRPDMGRPDRISTRPGTQLALHGLRVAFPLGRVRRRSEEHTSELQSLMRISYAVFCLKK